MPVGAQSTNGTIVGTIQDSSGSVIPGVNLRLTNIDHNVSQQTASNTQGAYEFVDLSPGRYSLVAEKGGFSPVRVRELTLEARQERRADLKLSIATASQTVEVTDQATQINTENATISDSENSLALTNLPANYRGNSISPLGAIVAFPDVQQDSTGNISVGGLNRRRWSPIVSMGSIVIPSAPMAVFKMYTHPRNS
jgi:hypothetical protein